MRNKILFAFVILAVYSFKPVSSIYDIRVQVLSSSQISLGSFAGKKLIVVEFDPVNFDAAQLLTLDTIQRSNAQVQVIGVPAKDFGSSSTIQSIQALVQNLNLSFIVTKPAYVKRSSGANQQDLFRWLTH